MYPEDYLFAKLFRNTIQIIPSATAYEPHGLPNADNTRIVRPARKELGKFARVQNSRENFQTVHNARARTREICAGIYDMNLAGLPGGNRIQTRKLPEQFVIAPCACHIVPAKCEYDNFRTCI